MISVKKTPDGSTITIGKIFKFVRVGQIVQASLFGKMLYARSGNHCGCCGILWTRKSK